MIFDAKRRLPWLVLPLLAVAVGCSNDSGPESGPTPPVPSCNEGVSFDSTFAAIQTLVFERHGCTQNVCHGSSASGGLDLSADVAYDNVYEVPASGASMNLVTPGDRERSYLWLKLAAKLDPDRWPIAGAPMPNNLPAISEDELELVRLWIYAGAPREGTVLGTDDLIDGCLPEPEPISIEPLPPPAPGTGIQWVMPTWNLPAADEFEGCMASYYDVTDQVPQQYRDSSGLLFRWGAFEVRQDSQSHHLLLYMSPQNFTAEGVDVHHPSFGQWTCMAGPRAGTECEPKDLEFCGEGGTCTSKLVASFACGDYGPPTGGIPAQIIGGAPAAQANWILPVGVYQQFPLKGVIYWNSHAFNLTSKDHSMNARLNYLFADQQIFEMERISDFSAISAMRNPPFTIETYCNDHVFPIGARVFYLFGHNHKHGDRFWVTMPDGTMIYENFDFSDPVQGRFDPPLEFDSRNAADRTVRYCATFNNGLNPDGSFNVEKVTRASRVPETALQFGSGCSPVACVNDGMVGKPCRGADDDAACDSSPGAGDGNCDACNITFGESTENEMFVLFGGQYVDTNVPGAELDPDQHAPR